MNPIPRSFQLGGRTWQVRMVTEQYIAKRSDNDDEPALGICCAWDAEILIVEGLKTETAQAVFYHELAHALFETLGWEKLSKNEGRVDAMGTMIHQFLQTQDY